MVTATQIINGAYAELGIIASETAIEASELQFGLEVLNDMLAEWEAGSLQLGFAVVENATDEIRIPRKAHRAVKLNLAIALAPSFSRPVTLDLRESARASKSTLLSSTINLNVQYPDGLPLGSGNECEQFTEDQKFFPTNSERNF
jgi:hypothetical protein